ncbi:MAG: NAD(P)-dependent oxidoreductase [Opitutales bacterium]
MSNPRVGLLGLGLIGSVWARHLHADGVLGGAWNRTPQPEFPGWCPDPAEVCARSEVLIICVADPVAVEEVLEAAGGALQPHHLVVQSSTIDPRSAERFAAWVEARGARYVEAPFTGSLPAAQARETVFYLGGAEAVLEAVEPVLAPLSKARFRVGSAPQAATLKLAFNMQIAAQAQMLCESLHLCREAGIADDTFFACLRPNVAWSGLTTLKEPKLRAADYAPQFSVKHLAKDVRLALASGAATALPATTAVSAKLEEALAAGFGEEDFIALYKLLANEAG